MKKKIVLYGTGVRGEKFYWSNLDKYDICYCIDRNNNRTFHGLSVYSVEEKADELKDYFIIIAAEDETYRKIAKILCNYGLIEGSCFMWEECLNKDIAILYGNCHMSAIRDYLEKNPVFCMKYCILSWYVHLNLEPLTDALLQNSKLLICQDIRKENNLKVPSAEEVESKTGADCQKIRIPNLYGFSSIFPQTKKSGYEKVYISHLSEESIDYAGYKHPLESCEAINVARGIAGTDENIDNMFFNGAGLYEIIESIQYGKVYSGVQEKFLDDIKKIADREKSCDVTISDFIRNHYQKDMLFYDAGHPTNKINIEYGIRILAILGITVYEKFPMSIYLDSGEVFIYGCVKEELGLKFKQEYIRCHRRTHTLWNQPLNLEGYVKQYIIWNFGVTL